MLAPALQKRFGVEQDVHALGEKHRNHAWIAWLTLFCITTLASVRQPCLMQRMHAGYEIFCSLDRCQRLTLKIVQPSPEQLLCGM